MSFKVLVIIPAFNEEATIQKVIQDVKEVNSSYDIVVINDASSDGTQQLALATNQARVIDLPVNLGIGGAVQTGLKIAAREKYDYAVQFDADGQHKAEDIPKLIDLLINEKCDVAIGSRFVGDSRLYESDWLRRLGIRLFEWVSLVLIRKRIRDHTSGFRAFNKRTIEFIMHEYPVDYPEPEIVVYLARNEFVIREIFTQMFSRQGGASSISVLKGPHYMFKVVLAMLMAAIRPKEIK